MNKIHYSRQQYREDYLNSIEWKEKSKIILSRDTICQVCLKNPSTDVHHLTYERLEHEDLNNDLAGVCRKCHNRIHKHRELESITNISLLRIIFQKSKKNYIFKEGLLTQILNSPGRSQQSIASILKVSISNFHKLLNRKINYFKMQKIFHVLQNPIKPIPKKFPSRKAIEKMEAIKKFNEYKLQYINKTNEQDKGVY